MSDTDVMKDAAVLLFLNDVDERLYMLVQALFPPWMDQRNDFIANIGRSLHLNYSSPDGCQQFHLEDHSVSRDYFSFKFC